MERTSFGKTGLEVSPLGFGGAPIGFLETEVERVGQLLNFLLDNGVNVIDTAAMYRGSEDVIGQTIGDRRDEYVLVSKCGHADSDFPGLAAWSKELIHKTIDRSLQRLRTDRIDVMLLHTCELPTLEKGDAVAALVEAREAGKIRFAGYSGDNEAAAYAASAKELAVLETSVNICDQVNLRAGVPGALENDVGVIAKRPIANAAWKSLDEQRGMYQDYAKVYHERFEKIGLTLDRLGLEGDMDWPEVALRFTLSQPGVHTAIVGTTNPENAKANIEAVRKGPLPDEVMDRIQEAFDEAERRHSTGAWLGQA